MPKFLAPVSGRLIPIATVPDPVFAQKLVGDGIAIDPTSQTLLAPISGTVVQLHSAHHALTLQGDAGLQVLMHIGLDTVQLKGEGFVAKVKVGDKVTAGQPLIEFSADLIAQKAKSLITLMVVVSGQTPTGLSKLALVTAGRDVVFEVNDSIETPTVGSSKAAILAESRRVLIQLPTGVHARPAAMLVSIAKSFNSKIEICKNGRTANAKSVVAILGMEICSGEQVLFRGEGSDAQKAVTALADFLEKLEDKTDEHAGAPPVRAQTELAGDPDKILFGIGVSPGLALGRLQQLRAVKFNITEKAGGSVAQEKSRLHQALQQGANELQELAAQVKGKADGPRAAIFAAHQELLDDPDILELTASLIAKGKSAAFAWNQAINQHAERLAGLNNELMAFRANDLRDVGSRVLRHLAEVSDSTESTMQAGEVILSAENLTPSETVKLDGEKVVGFCTTTGGATSHVAILARSLGLPAIAGIDRRILLLHDGVEVILDGDRGEVRINPSAADKANVIQMQTAQREKRKGALEKAHSPALTRDGHRIEVAANIGSVNDAEKAVEMGADGVGLLRSEFLFLERTTAPSEDEQFQIYQKIADTLGARPLIIRTLDVGGDKPLQYLPLEHEDNPFLGLRGIRIGLRYPEILRTQLRAILRVRSKGKIHVMFPMIATLEEFRAAKAMLEEERTKLKAPPVAVGIMVEVPSVALTADDFAGEVDFFSIGTNDLTQYTLAMDRGHKDLAKQADAMHPGVLKLIELTCRAAKAHGKWVGVCGGLAGDLKAVPVLLQLGIEELSVSIPSIPLVKAQVRESFVGEQTAQKTEANHVRH